jgi:dimethylargininase
MRVFDFDRAIVREPGRSVVAGIRSDLRAEPDFAGVAREHRAYVAALRAAGLDVEVLPPLEPYPDSVFVEDPALVLPEGAVLLRPGAATRLGERDGMRDVLRRHFERVLELADGEFVDGGDVLVTPDIIFIGLSGRTNRVGATALRARLATLGRAARIAETPPSILHFKTACSLLSEDTIVATKAMWDSGIFAGFDIVPVPEGEEAAANLLRINDAVFVGARFPRTIDVIAKAGFNVVPLPVTEIGKLDAGLSCMSLRWRSAPAA